MSDQLHKPNDFDESPYLNPINRTLVVDEVIDRLIDLIVHENLKPGDKLPTERELMSRLAIGRSSLREAVKTLSAIGAVEVRQGSGIYVGVGDISSLTKPFAWDLFLNKISLDQIIEARSVIEVSLVSWAAERRTEDDIANIGEILSLLEKSKDNKEEYTDYDIKFHLAIANASQNKILMRVLTIFQELLRMWMEITYQEAHGSVDSMIAHRKIFEAIKNKDSRAAQEIMNAHTSGEPLKLAAAQNYMDSKAASQFLFLTKNGSSRTTNTSKQRG